MSPTTREERGPYATWLACLFTGFGLAWIVVAIGAIYERAHPGPPDDVGDGTEPVIAAGIIVLVLAALPIVEAARIRWAPRTGLSSIQLPLSALFSVLITGVGGGTTVYFEFAYPWHEPDWRTVGVGMLPVLAALSVVVLVVLRTWHFRRMRQVQLASSGDDTGIPTHRAEPVPPEG